MLAPALIHNKSTFSFESQLPRSCFAYIRKLLRKSKSFQTAWSGLLKESGHMPNFSQTSQVAEEGIPQFETQSAAIKINASSALLRCEMK